MASQGAANSGSSPATAQTATPQAKQSAATQASPSPAKQPADELLCTICGLTACWTKPGESPKPAAAATPAGMTDAGATPD